MNTAINNTNTQLIDTINEHFGGEWNEKKIAVWGVSNDLGELDEATCDVIEWLVDRGVEVSVHDEAVIEEIKVRFGTNVECPETKWDCVRHANAVIVASRDAQYCNVDAGRLTWSVSDRTLFDVHSAVDRDSLKYSSFAHYTVDTESQDHPVTLPFPGNRETDRDFAPAALALVG